MISETKLNRIYVLKIFAQQYSIMMSFLQLPTRDLSEKSERLIISAGQAKVSWLAHFKSLSAQLYKKDFNQLYI